MPPVSVFLFESIVLVAKATSCYGNIMCARAHTHTLMSTGKGQMTSLSSLKFQNRNVGRSVCAHAILCVQRLSHWDNVKGRFYVTLKVSYFPFDGQTEEVSPDLAICCLNRVVVGLLTMVGHLKIKPPYVVVFLLGFFSTYLYVFKPTFQ